MHGSPAPAHQRAVYDLGCPKEQIEVSLLSGTTYVARGCGKEATYMCSGSNFMTEGTCFLESQKQQQTATATEGKDAPGQGV
jgi:hypothetical protein